MKIILTYLGLLAFGPALAQENAPVPTFETKVKLVLVPVVVRDSHGRAVAHLTKDDFEILDKRKKQTISAFSAVEQGAGAPKREMDPAVPKPVETDQQSGSQRHFIYLFDDLNIRFESMAQVRAAAVAHFKNKLAFGDRAAIYAFSGNPSLDFTDDPEKLGFAVANLRWRAQAGRGGMQCPDVSYYVADLIINKADGQALTGLTQHVIECAHVRPELARAIAMAAANRQLIIGAQDTRVALGTIRRAIRQLSGMPGQRVLVLASPGFFAQNTEGAKAMAEALDLAARSNVIISGLSVRGVIVAEEEEDVTRKESSGRKVPPSQNSPAQLWTRYRRESARADGDVMKDLAEGTGGTFFHNNNDLRVGFDRVSAAPEFSYVLGFSPTDLELDGSFHSLKVRLPQQKGVSIEARRGYYAFKPDSKDRAAEEDIADAVFSRDQTTEIPVVLQTGFSKRLTGDEAKVQLIARIDLKGLHFQKTDERSRDSLGVVAALFDSAGAYVTGNVETVSLALLEETLAKKDPALTLRFELPAKPGDYLIRFVIREPGGRAMTMLNRAVKIP